MGQANSALLFAVTKTRESIVVGQAAHAPGRPPPDDSLYARLEETTQADRIVDLTNPSDEMVASLSREIRRAAGEIQDEG
jgi:hypothetical protein